TRDPGSGRPSRATGRTLVLPSGGAVMRRSWLLAIVVLAVLCWTAPVTAATVQLASLAGFCNPGFEDDLDHSCWTATVPNLNYSTTFPEVNPVIYPNNPLQAADGNNFIGILNDDDSDVAGKLVHDAVLGSFPTGTKFEITVCATRGHLRDDPPSPGADPFFPLVGSPSPEVRVQFFAWKAGTAPSINLNNNWTRAPTYKTSALQYTAWRNSDDC